MAEELKTSKRVREVDPEKLEQNKILISYEGRLFNPQALTPEEFDGFIAKFFLFPDRDEWPAYQRADFLSQLNNAKVEILETE